MRLLLDTHAFLWWVTDDERLSAAAKLALIDRDIEVFVGAASAWEIATKQRRVAGGRLPAGTPRSFRPHAGAERTRTVASCRA